MGTTKIKNIVNEPTKQSTKILLEELLVQAETIRQPTARLNETERNLLNHISGFPSMVSTDASSVISARNKAM